MVVWVIAFYCPVKHISQDHRILRVGWDLWRSFDPTALTSQGHTWQVTQGRVQGGLQCVQRGRPHTTLGSLSQCSTTLSGKFSMSGYCIQHHSSLHPQSQVHWTTLLLTDKGVPGLTSYRSVKGLG